MLSTLERALAARAEFAPPPTANARLAAMARLDARLAPMKQPKTAHVKGTAAPSAPSVPTNDERTADEQTKAAALARENSVFLSEKNDAANKIDEMTYRLRKGCEGVKGILASRDSDGKELVPYPHQLSALTRVINSRVDFFLIAHEAGMGKTALVFMIKAAFELKKMSNGRRCGGCRTIISVPPSTLAQWEQTAIDWLRLPTSKIVVTNRSSDITAEVLENVRVLIVSRQLISKLYADCFKIVSRRNEQTGQYYSVTERLNVPLHPLFRRENAWDLMIVDEAHFLRNPATAWSASHRVLSKLCKFRIALSATPLVNRPSDMAGLCASINAVDPRFNLDFCKIESWSDDKRLRRIKMDTVRAWQEHMDRVDDKILNLPEIHQQVRSFRANFLPSDAEDYNVIVKKARQLRCALDQRSKQRDALRDLIGLLQKMQQMLVSPELARLGSEHFQKNPHLFKEAAAYAKEHDLGSLAALRSRLAALRADGHRRIIVSSVATAAMRIAIQYIGDEFGDVFLYHGGLSLGQRQEQKVDFLTCDAGVMFLSITAGGTGLHLVPGCNAMVFWGSRPFSPAQVWQTLKRIHRIGQTEEVFIEHLVALGSVDYAIDKAHRDKSGLASAIVDGDFSHVGEDDQIWKKQSRIVDSCHDVETSGPQAGNFKLYPSLDNKKRPSGGPGPSRAGAQRRKLTTVKRVLSPSSKPLIGSFKGFK